MKKYILLNCIFFTINLFAQSYNPAIQTWVIDAETAPCNTVSDGNCLLYRVQGLKEFEILNEKIEGFDYENGYIYTISVQQQIKQPPIAAGESVFKYVWIKTINKKEVIKPDIQKPKETTKTNSGAIIGKTEIYTSSTLDGKWYLRKMIDNENTSLVIDDNVIYIDIKTFNDRIDGFGSCNKFATVLKSDVNTTFYVSKLTKDYNYCGYKKLEDEFFEAMQSVDKFEIRNDGNLILSKQWNFSLGFTKNPNNKEEISITYTPPNIVKNENKTYVTNQNTNNSQDVNLPPVKTSEIKETTASSSKATNLDEQQKPVRTNISSNESSISDDADAIGMQRKIDDMQKALAAKKQKAIDDAKKAEEKLASDKEAELKKRDELKQQELAAAQAAEQAKAEATAKDAKDAEKATQQKAIDDAKIASDKEAELKKRDEFKQQELAAAQAAEQAKAAEAAKAKADKVAKLKAEQERLQKEMDELDNGTAITTTSKSSMTVESTTTKPITNSTKSVVTKKPIENTNSVIKQETKTTNNLVFQEPKTIGVYAQEKEIAIGLITDNQTNLSKSFAFVELFNNNPIQLDNKILSAKIVDFVYTSYFGIEGVIYENNVNLKFYKEGKKIKDIKCNNDWESIFNAILVEIQKFGDYKYNGKFQVVKEGKHANFYNRKIVNNLPGKLRIEVPETKIINLKSINANIEKYTSKNPTQEVKELIGNYSESDLNEIFEYRSAFVLPSYKSTLKPLLYPISKTMAFSLKMLSYGGVFIEKKENNLALNCFYTALNAIKETISSSKEKAIINCIAFKNISDIYNITENRKEMTKLLALASDINNDFSNSDVAKKEFDEYYLATDKVLALAVAQYRSTGSPGLSILSAVTGSLAASSGSFSNLGVDLSSLTSSLSSINSQLQTMQQSNTSSSNEISPIDNKLIAESFIVDGVDIKNSNNYVSSEVLYYLMTNPLIIKTTLLEYSNDKPKLNKLLLDFYNSKETNKATLIQDVYTQLNKIETVIIGLEARNKVVEEKYKLNF